MQLPEVLGQNLWVQPEVLWFWKIALSSYSWFYMSKYLKYVEKHVGSAYEWTTQKPDKH